MSSAHALFQPLKLGNQELKHRIVHVSMTRMRCPVRAAPNDLVKEYYEQRATDGGLLITEATIISRRSGLYPMAPGIFTEEQVTEWKKVTDAVHTKGGIIYSQLWHLGRVGTSVLNEGRQPVSASDIAISGADFGGNAYEKPRSLTIPEIKEVVNDFKQAALNAIEAGFDGIEIHSAHGYLLDQFICTSTNKRTDIYGGSIENRCRFSLEVVDAIVDAIGAERTSIRLSPWTNFYDTQDDTPYETFKYITKEIQNKHPNLAFIHFVEPRSDLANEINRETPDSLDPFREIWKGTFISAGGYTGNVKLAFETAEKTGNLIGFGRQFTSNPDLVERIRNDWPMAPYDRSKFYGGDATGYTDYPYYKKE